MSSQFCSNDPAWMFLHSFRLHFVAIHDPAWMFLRVILSGCCCVHVVSISSLLPPPLPPSVPSPASKSVYQEQGLINTHLRACLLHSPFVAMILPGGSCVHSS